VNPGEHRVAFSAQGLAESTKVFVFSEGEKLRREVVLLEPKPEPNLGVTRSGSVGRTQSSAKQPDNPRVRLVLPIAIASSVALLGGVGIAYFGLEARAKDRSLGTCSPNCPEDSVRRTKRDYLLANVSLGLAAAGLATASVLLVVEFRSAKSPTRRQLGLELDPRLAGMTLHGSF
jgi:hypothetical protein